MRKLIATLSVVSLLAGLAAVAAFGSTTKVSWHVGTSKTLRIHKGSKVTWVWTGDAKHDVKAKGFHSIAHSGKGATYSHTFRSTGKFTIVCTFHPGAMKTVVKVS